MVFLSAELKDEFQEEEALRQLADAASLPGVYRYVIGMPDIHSGFGLPIGGVMATDAESGIVSAGAVGMDINCGVRLLKTNLTADDLSKVVLRSLMEAIEQRVPTGIGKKSKHVELRQKYIEETVTRGAAFLVERGFGYPEDLEAIEECGCLAGADLGAVSKEAQNRADQLATIGGGNHFIEIGYVDEISDEKLAGEFGLKPGMVTVLIHTGSRGFGHQICTDYTSILARAAEKMGLEMISKGLAYAPIASPEGQNYLKAMACAVNFAFANRQLITHDVRQAFGQVFSCDPRELEMGIVYDVAHNIAKWETHDGRRLLVHRKGATRALCAGHPDNPRRYARTGHPAIIPGSMGSSSYVVVGTDLAAETFYSVNHGAGRRLSRTQARKLLTEEELRAGVGEVLVNVRRAKRLLDEAPQAYKDIDRVVETLVEIGLTRKVARLNPLAVIKGEGEE